MRAVRWLLMLLLVSGGCSRPTPGLADAGPVASTALGADDGGVTLARLDAWLAWHAALAKLPPLGRRDGGASDELRQRAREEARLLAEVGLTSAAVEQVEAAVAAVVAERTVAHLTGAEALAQFTEALAALPPEQRTRAEAALSATPGRGDGGSLAALEAALGAETVRVVLLREAEVTRTWDTLLHARGEGP